MRKSLLISSALIVLTLSLPLLVFLLAIRQEPVNPPLSGVNAQRLTEVQQLLINHDPRRSWDGGGQQSISLSQSEVNALLNYSLDNIPQLEGASGRVELMPSMARLSLSIPIPGTPLGQYIEIGLSLSQQAGKLSVESLDFGPLDIPGSLLEPLLILGIDHFQEDNNYRFLLSLMDAVEHISLGEQHLDLTLNWESTRLDNIRSQARQLFISEALRKRLLYYARAIADESRQLAHSGTRLPLHEMLQPLFVRAQLQSESGQDPVLENQALLTAMTIYLTDLTLADLLGPAPDSQPYPVPQRLVLHVESRRDLAQHLVASAAIAASAGANIAELLSVYKEMHDARYESGFSFTDITANQAGQQLGRLASHDPELALALQGFMGRARDASEYMPQVGPDDTMSEAEFLEIYGAIGSPLYQARMAQIQSQIAALPLIQSLEPNLTEQAPPQW